MLQKIFCIKPSVITTLGLILFSSCQKKETNPSKENPPPELNCNLTPDDPRCHIPTECEKNPDAPECQPPKPECDPNQLPIEYTPALPPESKDHFSIQLMNATHCAFTDDQIYIQIVSFDRNPDPEINKKSYILSSEFNEKAHIGEKDYYQASFKTSENFKTKYDVGSITLADLKKASGDKDFGVLYIPKDKTLWAARLYVSLGAPVKDLFVDQENGFHTPEYSENQKSINTPFDTIEFGFDPTNQQKFVFNSTNVDAFSIPMWYTVTDHNYENSSKKGVSFPVKVGAKTLQNRQDIIDLYKSETSKSKTFKLSNLSQGTITDKLGSEQPARILAPSHSQAALSSDYFNSAYDDFWKLYKSTSENLYPLKFCTNDPGPDVENRNVGVCFQGKVEGEQFKFWYYNTGDKTECKGEENEPPKTLCTVNKPDPKTATRCAINNECFYGSGPVGIFNTAISGAVMRGIIQSAAQEKDSPENNGVTWWNNNSLFYKTEPYNTYAKIMHMISINHQAYGFGYDDSGDESTAITPKELPIKNLLINIGW